MLTPSWHQESSGRSMDVYMKSGLHIDVHWTSKGLLMPTGIKYQAKTCKSYVRDNEKNICLKKVFSEKPVLAFHKMKSIRNYIVRTTINWWLWFSRIYFRERPILIFFAGTLFRKWNVLRFFASTYSPVRVSTIFCEDLFSRMVPPQALRKNLFLPKGIKFAKLAKINSLTVYL